MPEFLRVDSIASEVGKQPEMQLSCSVSYLWIIAGDLRVSSEP